MVSCVQAAEDAARRDPVVFTEDQVHEHMDIAQRFFKGGSFDQARDIYERLVANPGFAPIPMGAKPNYPEGASDEERRIILDQWSEKRMQRQRNREEVFFRLARCRLEMAGADKEKLEEVIKSFMRIAKNSRKYNKPVYTSVARYWAGLARLRANDPAKAAELFRQTLQGGASVELESEVERNLAKALIEQAQKVEMSSDIDWRAKEKKRRRLLEEAVAVLARATINDAAGDHRRGDDIQTMELYVLLRNYEQASLLAKGFLKKDKRKDDIHARAVFIRGECAYFTGKFNDAVLFYENLFKDESPDHKTRLEAHYRLGGIYVRLARMAGPQMQSIYLGKAQNSFRIAMKRMADKDPRRRTAMHSLVDVLISLGDYERATQLLDNILASPKVDAEAYRLAAVAARGKRDYGLAVGYFEKAFRLAGASENSAFFLDTLKSLADLELERKSYAAAYLYCMRMARKARLLRDTAAVAQAQMGMAKSLIGLGEYNAAKAQGAMRQLAGEFLKLSVLGGEQERGDRLAFALRMSGLWAGARSENYDTAISILSLLRQRYYDRVRKDELDFEEGYAIFSKANALLAKRSVVGSGQGEHEDVFQLYDRAAKIFSAASKANPRGTMAPKTNFYLGRTYHAKSALSFRIADALDRRGKHEDSRPYREEGMKLLEWSLPAFAMAAKTTSGDVELKSEAIEYMGMAYYSLENFNEALVQFRTLAKSPNTGAERRVRSTRWWAKTLGRLGNKNEAVKKLQAFVATDTESAIVAGQFLLELDRPRKAYSTFLLGVQNTIGAGHDRSMEAELLFRTYSLALHKASDLAMGERVGVFRRQAFNNLKDLARSYPNTEWAGRSLLTAGGYLLDEGRAEEAVVVAREAGRDARKNIETMQAVLLLEGRAYMALEKFSQAMDAFRRAELARADTKLGRAYRAAAIREQGNVSRVRGESRQALRYYSRVFAIFDYVHAEADAARISASEIYAKLENYKQAYAILDGGYDRQAMLDQRLLLQKRQTGEKED